MTLNLRRHLGLGACLLAAFVTACSDTSPTPSSEQGSGRGPSAQPVTLVRVDWEHENTRVEAVGTARARHSVVLYPDAAGEVTEVKFDAGDRVEEGQELLQLEAEDERLAVDMAEVELADAKRLLDRYRRSEGAGAVTPATLDTAESAVERARIALERAKEALEDRSLRAPFAGYMGLTTIDPGARITESTAVASLDDRSVLLVTFPLPEILLGQLVPGQEIQLSTWSNRTEKVTGTIVDVDSQVDPQTRTFLVRAHVNNAEDRLRPGMSFRIALTLQGPRYPTVPEVSLQWGGDGAYVWAVENGKAKRVAATIVQRRDGMILVDADLPEGTPVVAEGVQRIHAGQAVRDVSETVTAVEEQPQ